jgi:hypothetical protein
MKTSLLPYKPAELAHNRALGGIVTKYKTRDRNDDDQQRSKREDRIVSIAVPRLRSSCSINPEPVSLMRTHALPTMSRPKRSHCGINSVDSCQTP